MHQAFYYFVLHGSRRPLLHTTYRLEIKVGLIFAAAGSNQSRELRGDPRDRATPIWAGHGTKRGIVLISIPSHSHCIVSLYYIYLLPLISSDWNSLCCNAVPLQVCHSVTTVAKSHQHRQCNSGQPTKIPRKAAMPGGMFH